jgi:thiol-disulfide isomerase/thioredoxin
LRLTRVLALSVLVTVLVAACGRTTGPAPTAAVVVGDSRFGGLAAGSAGVEFAGLDGWLNSEPLTLTGLAEANRVVLVDFWTYTCVNCLRTLPFLSDWHAKYGDRGLTIVGVHTPEFHFERRPENVAMAVRDLGIRCPVAQDNEMATWRAFHNSVWPAKYLLTPDGVILYRHFGEGDYAATEEAIRSALIDAGYDISGIAAGGVPEPQLDRGVVGITRELYGGYERNYFPGGVYAAQEEYYVGPDRTHLYRDPGPPRQHHKWYTEGEWRNEAEAMVHSRQTHDGQDYIAFQFFARAVNVVMHPSERTGAYDVAVEVDGRPLSRTSAGPDVWFDEAGRSLVTVDQPRMYRVVQLDALGEHELRLRMDALGANLYAVTFGAYTEGP